MSLLNPSQLHFEKLNFYYRLGNTFMTLLKVFAGPLYSSKYYFKKLFQILYFKSNRIFDK